MRHEAIEHNIYEVKAVEYKVRTDANNVEIVTGEIVKILATATDIIARDQEHAVSKFLRDNQEVDVDNEAVRVHTRPFIG